MGEISTRLNAVKSNLDKDIKMKEEMMPVVKVSQMAELLVSKFKKNSDENTPQPYTKKIVS